MRPFLILTLLLMVPNLFGQSDFQPGYIITNTSDTINGLIDNRGELKNMRVCTYKETDSSNPVEYLPGTIKGYRFNTGKFFITKSLNTKNVKDTVFVEFLLNGIVNLYYYKNLNFDAYYIESEGKELLEMESKLIPVERDRMKYLVEDKRYIGMLTLAFADSREIQQEIPNTRLGHKSLISLTKKYHDYVCTDEVCVIYEKKLPFIKVEFNPFVGISLSTLKYFNKDLKGVDFRPSVGAAYGIGFNFRFPRMNERLSLQTTFALQDNYFYGTTKFQDQLKSELYYYHINNTVLYSSLAIRHTFPKGKFRPVFFAGIFNTANLTHHTNKYYEYNSSNTIRTHLTHPDLSSKSPLGFCAGAGVKYQLFRKLTGFSKVDYYISKNSVGQLDRYATNITSFQLSSGISF